MTRRLPALLLAVLLAVPAQALDTSRAAIGMAQAAATAYEAGDFQRAADLYLSAFKTAPDSAEYLYGAARAEHVGGKLVAAEAHYRQFMAHAAAKSDRVAKAQAYLDELRLAQSDQLAADGERSLRAENYAVALRQFLDAYALAPKRPAYLLQAAHAALTGGDLARAEALARDYLGHADATQAGKQEAQTVREQVQRKRGVVSPDKAKPEVPEPNSAQPSARTAKLAAWGVLAGGTALVLTGGGFYWHSRDEHDDLAVALAARNPAGQVVGVSRQEALAQQAAIDRHLTTAAVCAGAGAVALAAGAWLWLRAGPRPVGLAPGPGEVGVALVLRL